MYINVYIYIYINIYIECIYIYTHTRMCVYVGVFWELVHDTRAIQNCFMQIAYHWTYIHI